MSLDLLHITLGILVFLLLGGCVVLWLRLQSQRQLFESQLALGQEQIRSEKEGEIARLETQLVEERSQSLKKLEILQSARDGLIDQFRALAMEALTKNNETFLRLAEGELGKKKQDVDAVIKPIRESLEKFGTTVHNMEKQRVGAYEGLAEKMRALTEAQMQLRGETSNLVKALRVPQVRGRWGEIQLKRVIELAGMVSHCDFFEQESIATEEGRLRPDMVIRLPGNRQVVVDSKVALDAYLDALETDNETQQYAALERHARQMRDHVNGLSRKAYWEQFEQAPDFVVLFIPMETAFGAALDRYPTLIEEAAESRVILATPTTLIALLRAVHYGWRQESMVQNVREISALGKDLYERIATMAGHFANIGKGLANANDHYNKAISSLESRVLVSARKFQELKAVSGEKEIPSLSPIDQIPRTITADELQASGEEVRSEK